MLALAASDPHSVVPTRRHESVFRNLTPYSARFNPQTRTRTSVPLSCFFFFRQVCDWNGADCTRDCCLLFQHRRGVTDGTRVRQFRNGAASVGSAASRDCSRLVEARSSASFFIKEKQQQRIWNYAHETCMGSFRVHMAQLSMPTSHTVAPWMLGKSFMRDVVASSFAFSVKLQRKSMLTAASGSTKCVPCARGERWRKRHVLTDRCRCSVRHCGSWRDVFNDGYWCCVQRWRGRAGATQDTARAGAMVSTTDAGAAYPTGAGEMYRTTGAGAVSLEGASAMCSSTGAGAT